MSKTDAQPGAKPEKPLPAEPISLADELHQPNMTEKLLNAQLAEALSLIRDAAFLYRNSRAEANERGFYINHAEQMIAASAAIAERIAKLGGGDRAAERRFRYTIEHVAGPREGEGGSPDPENE